MHLNRKNRIEKALNEQFNPSYLEVLNESFMHRVPENAETHFKVVMVSSIFENTPTVQRHKKVYSVMQSEMAAGLHALSLHLYTPTEWQKNAAVLSTPHCAHKGDESKQ